MNENIYNSLSKEKVSTLNNTKYILIEFPLDHKLKDAHTVVYNLVKMGYVPIIAHPERYISYSNDEIIFQTNGFFWRILRNSKGNENENIRCWEMKCFFQKNNFSLDLLIRHSDIAGTSSKRFGNN